MQRGHITIMHRRKLNIVASSLTFHSPGTRCAKYRHDNKYVVNCAMSSTLKLNYKRFAFQHNDIYSSSILCIYIFVEIVD